MKNRIIITAALMLSVLLAATVHAQVRESVLAQKRDTVILREGNVDYIRTGSIAGGGIFPEILRTTIERADTKDLQGKSYEYLNLLPNSDYGKMMNDLFRSVFSKERASQLENMRIACTIRISPAENRIMHIQFYIMGDDSEKFPLQLSELHELDQRIRAEPKAFPPYDGSGKIVDHWAGITMPRIDFRRLYE